MKISSIMMLLLLTTGVFLGVSMFYSEMALNYGSEEIKNNQAVNNTLTSLQELTGSQVEKLNETGYNANPSLLDYGVTFITSGYKAARIVLSAPGIVMQMVFFTVTGLSLPDWVTVIINTAIWIVVIVTMIRVFTKGEV